MQLEAEESAGEQNGGEEKQAPGQDRNDPLPYLLLTCHTLN